MTRKPKIALVVDVDNWAFGNISKQIIKNLSHKYDFKYLSVEDLDNMIRLLLVVQDCDLVHFFWRGNLSWIGEASASKYLDLLGCEDPKGYLKTLISNVNFSTAVYDHLYLDKEIGKTKKILKKVKNYYVCSNKLYEIYKKIEGVKKPQMVITDGVDLKKFFPKNLARFKKINSRKIVIGWVGNSKWFSDKEDFKGVRTILKPAIEELVKEGYNLEMFFADKAERMIPHDEMNEYYSKIDLYICTSSIEGTPNPVLESMACGVPVISTDVGIVNDAFGKKQKQMILEKRSVKCLKEKIVTLIKNPKMFEELSQENLESIKSWTWEEKMKDFNIYFEKCLEK
jgi:glycosyltransferase involved in cell wall biosynthesis